MNRKSSSKLDVASPTTPSFPVATASTSTSALPSVVAPPKLHLRLKVDGSSPELYDRETWSMDCPIITAASSMPVTSGDFQHRRKLQHQKKLMPQRQTQQQELQKLRTTTIRQPLRLELRQRSLTDSRSNHSFSHSHPNRRFVNTPKHWVSFSSDNDYTLTTAFTTPTSCAATSTTDVKIADGKEKVSNAKQFKPDGNKKLSTCKSAQQLQQLQQPQQQQLQPQQLQQQHLKSLTSNQISPTTQVPRLLPPPISPQSGASPSTPVLQHKPSYALLSLPRPLPSVTLSSSSPPLLGLFPMSSSGASMFPNLNQQNSSPHATPGCFSSANQLTSSHNHQQVAIFPHQSPSTTLSSSSSPSDIFSSPSHYSAQTPLLQPQGIPQPGPLTSVSLHSTGRRRSSIRTQLQQVASSSLIMAATKRVSVSSKVYSSRISGIAKMATEAKRSAVTALTVANPRLSASHLMKTSNRVSVQQGRPSANSIGSRESHDAPCHAGLQANRAKTGVRSSNLCCCISRNEANLSNSSSVLFGTSGGGGTGLSGMKNKSTTVGYRLGKRKILYERRKRISDYCLIFALLGIAVMVVEAELCSAEVFTKDSFYSLGLKTMVTCSTIILLVLIVVYRVLETQLFIVDNCLEDWRIAVSGSTMAQLLLELFVCSIHPAPTTATFLWPRACDDGGHKPEVSGGDGEWGINRYLVKTDPSSSSSSSSLSSSDSVQVPIDLIFSLPMFLRLYLIPRVMLLHSRLFSDASSRSIGALNRITFNTRFIMKTLMTICPGTVLLVFMLSLWIILSWMLKACEGHHEEKHKNILNSMWLISITFLSVGYGDIVPNTYCGRGIAVITGVMGAGCTALVVAVLAKKLELSRAEKHVHNFMMDTQLTKQLKYTAANVLRETWLIYKNSKLTKKVNTASLRVHQRKFLRAIHSLRQVKLEQRKLTDNANTVVDIAKSQANLQDIILDMNSRQTSMEQRLSTMFERIANIQAQVDVLPMMIAKQLERSSAVNHQ